MRTVRYKTENATFNFDFDAVQKHLKSGISEHNLTENRRLLEALSNSSEDNIEINPDDSTFGYIILELIESGTGQVTCKKCNKIYKASQLIPFALGAGKSPFKLNIDIKFSLRNLFRRRKRNPSLIGGSGYKCSAGHELISMITWRT